MARVPVGLVWQFWLVQAARSPVRYGKAVLVGLGVVWSGLVWQSRFGTVWHVEKR